MELSKLLAISQLVKAAKIIKENLMEVVLCAIIDALFFFAYGFLGSPIKEKLIENIIVLGTLVSEAARNAASRYTTPSIFQTLFTDVAKPYAIKALLLLLLLGIIFFIIYCVFQGLNWAIANHLVGSKMKISEYFLKFAGINIFWLSAFGIYNILDLTASLRKAVMERVSGGEFFDFFGKIVLLLLILIIYFALSSYALLKIRKAFSFGAKNFLSLLQMFFFLAVIYLAIDFILDLASFNPDFMLAVGIILFLPALTLARMYILLFVRSMRTT